MISVIGAGPAGSMAAMRCSKEHDTFLYEAQKKEQRRVQCAGLISRSGFERLGITPSKDYVLNSVRGARIYSPKGSLLEVDGGRDKAYVVDRKEFDNHLMGKAIDAGAILVNDAVGRQDIEEIRRKSEKLVIASGTNYNIHRILGLQRPHEFLNGAQYELKIQCDADYVEMYLNVPGFFSWIIPAGDYARVGLCTKANPVPHLDSFVKRLAAEGRIKDARILKKNFGMIPLYDHRMRAQYPGIVLVGDAAGQVKATSGGGIVMGGLAAKHVCAEDYEKRWRSDIGRELRLHVMVRRFLNRLSDKNLDKLIKLLSENREIIEQKGDMDMASNLLAGLLKNPRFMAGLLFAAPGYIWDIL